MEKKIPARNLVCKLIFMHTILNTLQIFVSRTIYDYSYFLFFFYNGIKVNDNYPYLFTPKMQRKFLVGKLSILFLRLYV